MILAAELLNTSPGAFRGFPHDLRHEVSTALTFYTLPNILFVIFMLMFVISDYVDCSAK